MHISWNIDVLIQLVPSFLVTGLLAEGRLLFCSCSWLFLLSAAGLSEAVFFQALVVAELVL